MLIAQTQEEFKAALSIQTHCELDHITLLRCSTSRAPAGSPLSEPYTLNGSNSSTAKLIGDIFCVEASFVFGAVDAKKEQVFSTECVYELCYKLREGYKPTDNEIEAFKTGNAIFNCWPYVREFFQNITSRMGYAPPSLPLLRVVPKQPASAEPTVKPKAVKAVTTRPVHRRKRTSAQ